MKYSEKSDKSAFTNLTAPPMMKECPPHPWSVPDDVFGETVRPISDVTTIVTLSHNPAATNASRKPLNTPPISVNLLLRISFRLKCVSNPPKFTAKVSLLTWRASSTQKINMISSRNQPDKVTSIQQDLRSLISLKIIWNCEPNPLAENEFVFDTL